MQIRKSRGLGSIIEAAFDKAAAPGYRTMPGTKQKFSDPNALNNFDPTGKAQAPQRNKPPAPAATPPAAAPAAAPATPAGPYGAQLQQHWQQLMQQHGTEINKMSQWAAQFVKQPMVAKDPQLAASLTQFTQIIAALPTDPTSVPKLQAQMQALHSQLENFWVKWQQAYQRGDDFMKNSTQRLKAFDHFVTKTLNVKGLQKGLGQPQA